jgi:hypothetical protein
MANNTMNTDPLSPARGILLGVFVGAAFGLFVTGALLAATDNEHGGAICMVGAGLLSLFATVIGYRNAA